MFKVLVIGSGGREHAIAWKLLQDHRVDYVYLAPGNAGVAMLDRAENVELTDVDSLCNFALAEQIDLTIVGSEALLVEGIVNAFHEKGLRIFGPNQAAAMLEGSKSYAKSFMKKYSVKTAAYQSFQQADAALDYLKICPYPTVIKASGLAAGKGVVICQNQEEAQTVVREMMLDKRFGDAGNEVVIEEFLEGFEVSILCFCDGKTILPMRTAKDHKPIGDGNTGENTGGMGVVSPHPTMTDAQYQAFMRDVLQPTLVGIQKEQFDFAGVIFFGLMINDRGVFLLEYNMRFGDPETQAVLSLLKTPLLTPIFACLDHKLADITLAWEDKSAVCVVAASRGYPNHYQTGFLITNIEKARVCSQVFIAGAKYRDGDFLTAGGRVLNVVGVGESLEQARKTAYAGLQLIEFDGITYRSDIGIY